MTFRIVVLWLLRQSAGGPLHGASGEGPRWSEEIPSRSVALKAAKALFTEENFAILQELGGDVGTHANKALEVYMRWLREQDRSE
jgi:hypothetical protein